MTVLEIYTYPKIAPREICLPVILTPVSRSRVDASTGHFVAPLRRHVAKALATGRVRTRSSNITEFAHMQRGRYGRRYRLRGQKPTDLRYHVCEVLSRHEQLSLAHAARRRDGRRYRLRGQKPIAAPSCLCFCCCVGDSGQCGQCCLR